MSCSACAIYARSVLKNAQLHRISMSSHGSQGRHWCLISWVQTQGQGRWSTQKCIDILLIDLVYRDAHKLSNWVSRAETSGNSSLGSDRTFGSAFQICVSYDGGCWVGYVYAIHTKSGMNVGDPSLILGAISDLHFQNQSCTEKFVNATCNYHKAIY